MEWGNRHETFSIFFIENELFIENVNKGGRGNEPNGRAVLPEQLIPISIEAEFRALQNYREFFFEFHFSFRTIHFFFQKKAFLPIKLKVQTA